MFEKRKKRNQMKIFQFKLKTLLANMPQSGINCQAKFSIFLKFNLCGIVVRLIFDQPGERYGWDKLKVSYLNWVTFFLLVAFKQQKSVIDFITKFQLGANILR